MTVSMTTARHSLPLALLSLLLLLPPCALGSNMPGSMLALSAMLEDGALTAVEFQAAKRAVFIEAGLLPPAWPGQSAKEGAQSQQRPGAVVVPGMVPLPEGEGKQGGSGRRGGGGGGDKARAAGSLYPSGWSLSDEEKKSVARKTPRLVFYKLRQVAGTSVADMLLRGYAYLGLKACCEPGCYLCADHNSLSDECLDRACLGGDKSTVKLVTLMREPVDKAISKYLIRRKDPRLSRKVRDAAKAAIPAVTPDAFWQVHGPAGDPTTNRYLYCLLGLNGLPNSKVAERWKSFGTGEGGDDARLDAAMRRLISFDLVGITENMDEFMVALQALLGWPVDMMVYRGGVASGDHAPPDSSGFQDQVITAVRGALEPDRLLYGRAVSMAKAGLDNTAEAETSLAQLKATQRLAEEVASRSAPPEGDDAVSGRLLKVRWHGQRNAETVKLVVSDRLEFVGSTRAVLINSPELAVHVRTMTTGLAPFVYQFRKTGTYSITDRGPNADKQILTVHVGCKPGFHANVSHDCMRNHDDAALDVQWPRPSGAPVLLLPRQWSLAPQSATAVPVDIIVANEVAGITIRAEGVSADQPFLYNATGPGQYTVKTATGEPLLRLDARCHEGYYSDAHHRCHAIRVIHRQWRVSMEAADITAEWKDKLEFVGSMRGVLLKNPEVGVDVNTWTTLDNPYVFTFDQVGTYVALDKSENAESRRLTIRVTCPEGFAETPDHSCRRS